MTPTQTAQGSTASECYGVEQFFADRASPEGLPRLAFARQPAPASTGWPFLRNGRNLSEELLASSAAISAAGGGWAPCSSPWAPETVEGKHDRGHSVDNTLGEFHRLSVTVARAPAVITELHFRISCAVERVDTWMESRRSEF